MYLFLVFKTFGGPLDCPVFELFTVATSSISAQTIVNESEARYTGSRDNVHPIDKTMNKENNWTCFSNRTNFENVDIGNGYFGGYIIEKIESDTVVEV